MVVVELLDLNFPVDPKLRSVLDSDGEIATIVEATEFRGGYWSHVKGTSLGLLRCRLFLGLVEADDLSSKALSLLQCSYKIISSLTFSYGCL